MAEPGKGPVTQTRNLSDPPIGFFYLRLDCEFCGSKNGFLWPENGAPPIGTIYVAPPGTSGAGVCRRCGKSNRCRVMSQPPPPPPKVKDPWEF